METSKESSPYRPLAASTREQTPAVPVKIEVNLLHLRGVNHRRINCLLRILKPVQSYFPTNCRLSLKVAPVLLVPYSWVIIPAEYGSHRNPEYLAVRNSTISLYIPRPTQCLIC